MITQHDLQMITSRNHRVRVYLILSQNNPLNASAATAQFSGRVPNQHFRWRKQEGASTVRYWYEEESRIPQRKAAVRPRIQEPIAWGYFRSPLLGWDNPATTILRISRDETSPKRSQRPYPALWIGVRKRLPSSRAAGAIPQGSFVLTGRVILYHSMGMI